jgi:hypothetical protein
MSRSSDRRVSLRAQHRSLRLDLDSGCAVVLLYSGRALTRHVGGRLECETWIPFGDDPTYVDEVFYLWKVSRGEVEEPHLLGPAATIGALPKRTRRILVVGLFAFAAAVILARSVMNLFDMFKDTATELLQGATGKVSELTGVELPLVCGRPGRSGRGRYHRSGTEPHRHRDRRSHRWHRCDHRCHSHRNGSIPPPPVRRR